MDDTTLAFSAFILTATAVVLWFRALQRVEIPENRIAYVVACTIGLGLAIASLLGTPGWLGGTLATLSALAAGLFLLTVAIGGQKVSEQSIEVGDLIPQFKASDDAGTLFDSTTLQGNPTLIKFFRGHW